MPSDEKKHDLNQVFKSRDRDRQDPASPESAAETAIISTDERAFLRNQLRLQRVVSETFRALANKGRQKVLAAEVAAIDAELDMEFEQAHGGRERTSATIPQRSLEQNPTPRRADIQESAPVLQMKKAAAVPEKHSTDTALTPKIPEPRIPNEIAETVSKRTSKKEKADRAQRQALKRRLEEGKALSKREAAIYYDRSERTIYSWCNKKDTPLKTVKKRGRITAASILKFRPEDDIDPPA